jgi:CubicO group peptidase (beta-lactamase class C family)
MRTILLPVTLLAMIFLMNCNPGKDRPQSGETGELRESAATHSVDAFIEKRMDSLHIPGIALAVVQKGEVLYSRGYGASNLELNTPVIPESRFLIGSITKSFTAVALMMLWEEGRFTLEDGIGEYVEDLPDHWKPITIRQLLNHTSGIPTNLEPIPPCSFEADLDNYTRRNYLQEVMCLPLEFGPGTQWKYSSATGYDLLGQMIENLSGESYYEFIRNRFFIPLQMQESGWIDYETVVPNRVEGYYYVNGAFENSEHLDAVGEYAHGGLLSTTLDLVKFDQALFSHKLVKKTTLDLMLANATLTDGTEVRSYGLGFGLTPFEGHRRIGHTGSAPGFSTSYSRYIDDGLIVIMLANKDADYGTLDFSNQIARFYLD